MIFIFKKVGREFVNKGQNQAQVTNACAALSKVILYQILSHIIIILHCSQWYNIALVI